jgi:hypothetical protein
LEWHEEWVFFFFLVKKAYHLELKRRAKFIGESSSIMEDREMWRKLWALKLPRVTKNFLWKICHNLLPTKERLFHKNIVPDPLCPFCLSETETSFYILWYCPSSLAVWQECSRRVHKLSITFCKGRRIVRILLEKLHEEELQEVFTAARIIWMRRNSFIFKGDFLSLPTGGFQCKVDVGQFQMGRQ